MPAPMSRWGASHVKYYGDERRARRRSLLGVDAVEKGILRGSQSNIDSRSKVNAQS
jgi:hypothetical protein